MDMFKSIKFTNVLFLVIIPITNRKSGAHLSVVKSILYGIRPVMF